MSWRDWVYDQEHIDKLVSNGGLHKLDKPIKVGQGQMLCSDSEGKIYLVSSVYLVSSAGESIDERITERTLVGKLSE